MKIYEFGGAPKGTMTIKQLRKKGLRGGGASVGLIEESENSNNLLSLFLESTAVPLKKFKNRSHFF